MSKEDVEDDGQPSQESRKRFRQDSRARVEAYATELVGRIRHQVEAFTRETNNWPIGPIRLRNRVLGATYTPEQYMAYDDALQTLEEQGTVLYDAMLNGYTTGPPSADYLAQRRMAKLSAFAMGDAVPEVPDDPDPNDPDEQEVPLWDTRVKFSKQQARVKPST